MSSTWSSIGATTLSILPTISTIQVAAARSSTTLPMINISITVIIHNRLTKMNGFSRKLQVLELRISSIEKLITRPIALRSLKSKLKGTAVD